MLSEVAPRPNLAALLLGASHARRLRGEPSLHLHARFEIPADTVWVMHRLADFSYSFIIHTDEGIAVPSLPRSVPRERRKIGRSSLRRTEVPHLAPRWR
jgi:hypothetical protein